MEIIPILEIVGGCLLVLAVLSAIALFYKAVFVNAKSAGMDTLWGLFIFGLLMGFILIFSAHGCHR